MPLILQFSKLNLNNTFLLYHTLSKALEISRKTVLTSSLMKLQNKGVIDLKNLVIAEKQG